jgi:hypothetical protein
MGVVIKLAYLCVPLPYTRMPPDSRKSHLELLLLARLA